MSIFEVVIVAAVSVAAALALGLLVWSLALRSRHELYIAPFLIGGMSDAAPEFGIALANMLRARLERLQRELESARLTLERQLSIVEAFADDPTAIVLPTSVDVPRSVFEPVNIEVSIGKVSVGGLLSWLQRWALQDRTLQLTALFEGGRVIVSGSLEPLQVSKVKDLWVETAASAESVVTKTAHALLQSRVAESGKGPIQALDVDEFEDLLWCLYELAELNRRAMAGGSSEVASSRSACVLDRLTPLADRFPEWEAMMRLAVAVAESAEKPEDARRFRVRLGVAVAERTEPRLDPELAAAERALATAVAEWARRVFPDNEPPGVAYARTSLGDLWTKWNSALDRYEVNAGMASKPWIEGWLALMGHFQARHYRRCIEDVEASKDMLDLWNEFRHSVVAYLLETDPQRPVRGSGVAERYKLYHALKRLDGDPEVRRESLRELALTLLDRFSCDWTHQTLLARIAELNAELANPVPEHTLQAALAPVEAQRVV
jgi:hypothetical protein